MSAFTGPDELAGALQGTDLVIIPAGNCLGVQAGRMMPIPRESQMGRAQYGVQHAWHNMQATLGTGVISHVLLLRHG